MLGLSSNGPTQVVTCSSTEFAPLLPRCVLRKLFQIRGINEKAMGREFTSDKETKEFCGAAHRSPDRLGQKSGPKTEIGVITGAGRNLQSPLKLSSRRIGTPTCQ